METKVDPEEGKLDEEQRDAQGRSKENAPEKVVRD